MSSDPYPINGEYFKKLYYELRGTLDIESPESTIIVSLIGDFYVNIDGKEFKL